MSRDFFSPARNEPAGYVRRPMVLNGIRRVEMIAVSYTVGEGTEDDVVRRETALYLPDGRFVCVVPELSL